jgi:hypothetical protein
MKIEMCEQAVASWLRHIKECQIVETNWSPSPMMMDGISGYDYNRTTEFMIEVENYAKANNLVIFKKNKADQLIKQCEIDVVGINFVNVGANRRDDDGRYKLYLVDSAFHEKGLGYYPSNLEKVIEKLLRAVVVGNVVFHCTNAEIIFVTPFCRPKDKVALLSAIKEPKLNAIIDRFFPGSNIRIILNEDFTNEIFKPLVNNLDTIGNDNELFIRSLKLAKKAEEYSVVVSSAAATTTSSAPPKASGKTDNKTEVFKILNDLNSRNLLKNVLKDLCSPALAKTFKISSFPVLIKSADLSSLHYDKTRFYSDEIKIDGVPYLVCSQWSREKVQLFRDWALKL